MKFKCKYYNSTINTVLSVKKFTWLIVHSFSISIHTLFLSYPLNIQFIQISNRRNWMYKNKLHTLWISVIWYREEKKLNKLRASVKYLSTDADHPINIEKKRFLFHLFLKLIYHSHLTHSLLIQLKVAAIL